MLAVLWVDQSTVRTSTGLTPYYINCGSEPVLPIELEIPTWQILSLSEVHSIADLLAMRARQLQRRDEDVEEATLHLQRICLERKEWHDLKHGIRKKELAVGSIVLLYDTRREKSMSRKLAFTWLSPYQIFDEVRDKGMYILEKLDGSQLAGIFAGDRLKEVHLQQRLQLDHVLDQSDKEIPTLEEFFADDSDSNFSDAPHDCSDTADNFFDY